MARAGGEWLRAVATFPVVAIGLALLAGVFIGILDPDKSIAICGVLCIGVLIVFRQDQACAAIVIALALCFDWFAGTYILAPLMSIVLLGIFFLARSERQPFVGPRPPWLWLLFLGLTIWPALSPILHNSTTPYDSVYYYPLIVCTSFIMCWLGMVIGRDVRGMRRLFMLTAAFVTLIAIHTIIQALTGVFLFATLNAQTYLESVGNYQLGSSGMARAGSFFLQPDAGSAFLAMMVFLPAGLFVASSSFLAKLLYLGEILLILVALLFTYSTGAWLSAVVGMCVFIVLAGSMRFRLQILLFMVAASAVLYVIFSAQLSLLLQHGEDANGLILRQGLWETGLHIIQAYPLTGIGLSRTNYLLVSQNFRVAAAFITENNPHNAYVELGAMAGIPVLLVFVALIVWAFWQALRTWGRADTGTRSLLAGGIAAMVAVCFNNWSFGLWTLPPMVAPQWILLGALASPLLAKSVRKNVTA